MSPSNSKIVELLVENLICIFLHGFCTLSRILDGAVITFSWTLLGDGSFCFTSFRLHSYAFISESKPTKLNVFPSKKVSLPCKCLIITLCRYWSGAKTPVVWSAKWCARPIQLCTRTTTISALLQCTIPNMHKMTIPGLTKKKKPSQHHWLWMEKKCGTGNQSQGIYIWNYIMLIRC